MKRSTVGHLNCSIARTLDVVGEWWTLLVVRDIFFGRRRFDDIQRGLGISRNILSDRLATLVDRGLVERRPYQHRPDRYEYDLTAMGRDLWPVLTALWRFGDRWMSPDGPPLCLLHRGCGAETFGCDTCPGCDEVVAVGDVELRKGPGWREPAA